MIKKCKKLYTESEIVIRELQNIFGDMSMTKENNLILGLNVDTFIRVTGVSGETLSKINKTSDSVLLTINNRIAGEVYLSTIYLNQNILDLLYVLNDVFKVGKLTVRETTNKYCIQFIDDNFNIEISALISKSFKVEHEYQFNIWMENRYLNGNKLVPVDNAIIHKVVDGEELFERSALLIDDNTSKPYYYINHIFHGKVKCYLKDGDMVFYSIKKGV